LETGDIVRFERDDEGYLAWIDAHPTDFVINCAPKSVTGLRGASPCVVHAHHGAGRHHGALDASVRQALRIEETASSSAGARRPWA
jgi:hypothetical protein